MQKPMIIFTDLDGTLLDYEGYHAHEAIGALRAAQNSGVSVVFCSSKTRAEIEALQEELDVHTPFIVENGGAVYIPRGYFSVPMNNVLQRNGYDVIELGRPYAQIVTALRLIRSYVPRRVVAFSDLTVAEVAAECGLSFEEAARAKEREYDEPFRLVNGSADDEVILLDHIERRGLRCSRGGRFLHLHGASDKGEAALRLLALFERQGESLTTIGLGDSSNDLPFLGVVAVAFVVRKSDGSHDAVLSENLQNARLTQGIGPSGWAEAVMSMLRE